MWLFTEKTKDCLRFERGEDRKVDELAGSFLHLDSDGYHFVVECGSSSQQGHNAFVLGS